MSQRESPEEYEGYESEPENPIPSWLIIPAIAVTILAVLL